MIRLESKGNFSKTDKFFNKITNKKRINLLKKYGEEGVIALENATPRLTGKTANSWYYKITDNNNIIKLSFYNSNTNEGVPIAIILQYGHITGTGGWVEGVDYINPALRPIFNSIAQKVWKDVI